MVGVYEVEKLKNDTQKKSPVKKRLLNSEEVVNILKECNSCGVLEISYGDLHVKFGGLPLKAKFEQASPVEESPPPSSDDETSEKAKQIDADTLEIQEILFREQQLAEMLLNDPSEFEQTLATGDLEDEGPAGQEDL